MASSSKTLEKLSESTQAQGLETRLIHVPCGYEMWGRWGWEALEPTRYLSRQSFESNDKWERQHWPSLKNSRLHTLSHSEDCHWTVRCYLSVWWWFNPYFKDEAEGSPRLMLMHGLNFITSNSTIKMRVEEQLLSGLSVQVSSASRVHWLYLTRLTRNCVGQRYI